jgi:hypothetical protein
VIASPVQNCKGKDRFRLIRTPVKNIRRPSISRGKTTEVNQCIQAGIPEEIKPVLQYSVPRTFALKVSAVAILAEAK